MFGEVTVRPSKNRLKMCNTTKSGTVWLTGTVLTKSLSVSRLTVFDIYRTFGTE